MAPIFCSSPQQDLEKLQSLIQAAGGPSHSRFAGPGSALKLGEGMSVWNGCCDSA